MADQVLIPSAIRTDLVRKRNMINYFLFRMDINVKEDDEHSLPKRFQYLKKQFSQMKNDLFCLRSDQIKEFLWTCPLSVRQHQSHSHRFHRLTKITSSAMTFCRIFVHR
jgi:hypothetical protein